MSKPRLFETRRVELAAVLFILNPAYLVAVRGTKKGICWIFHDPKNQGEEFTRKFNAIANQIGEKGMSGAREMLFLFAHAVLLKDMPPLHILLRKSEAEKQQRMRGAH